MNLSDKLQKLKSEVNNLYSAKNPNRDPWADWLYQNHVLKVAQFAEELARQHAIDVELSQVSALLHDIADAVTARKDTEHEVKSQRIAKDLMINSGYSPEQMQIVLDDALRYHSCYPREFPKTDVGKVLASADAQAHLQTDFYAWVVAKKSEKEDPAKAKDWATSKLERDYNDKIFFDDLRQKVRPDYLRLKELFN